MNIKSKQIIDQIELYLNKFIKDINISDLDNISELTINGLDIKKNHMDFYLEDLILFKNLKKITFNRFILDVDTMNYIYNSKIEELDLYNCELFCEITNKFENIRILRVEYTSNFYEKYLLCFPNVKELSFKGYILKEPLSKNITKIDLSNTTVENTNIIEESNVNDLYISKKEYENHKRFYDGLIIRVNVFDENNCYLIGQGDKYE